ncbi:hypothetical protein CDV31_005270 [Fusarium ambrosium]|uniref:Uncharacterized protein n=1 Tax=Fusarium ambrosium TaxID=131363 RepID=A0A428UKM4_9HYPO|nr:hypothetical protein CDV31_005270 [Fusarium ambrosium]
MSGQGPQFGSTAAGSRGRSASAPPTILPRNGLVFEGIQNSLGQTVATGFRNAQGGTNENVLAATDALGNDSIAFQGDEHTVRGALERAITLASVVPKTQIAGFFFVAKPHMVAMSTEELQELQLNRIHLPAEPATSSGNGQTLADIFNMREENVDLAPPRHPRRRRRRRRNRRAPPS